MYVALVQLASLIVAGVWGCNPQGAKNEHMSRLALYMYMRMVCKIHPHARLKNVQVQNIVASGYLDAGVNLLALSQQKYEIVQYDPSIFPGCRISLHSVKSMQSLVFLSGKVIVTGAKTREQVQTAWEETLEIVTPFIRTAEEDIKVVVTHRDLTQTTAALRRAGTGVNVPEDVYDHIEETVIGDELDI